MPNAATRAASALLLLGLALVLAAGCAKKAPSTAADYYASSQYQDRETLQQSLFRGDQLLLSNEEIDRILSSKIELPRNAHLTVLRLGSASDVLAWAFLDDGEGPLAELEASPRLSRVSWLPSLLVPEKLTVPFLREAAARFQADLLLAYRTPCRRFQDYRLFGSDEARTYCVAEGVLLDVRTGIVPFSGVATARVETTRAAAEDTTLRETLEKAEARATGEALAGLASQLGAFLAAASD